ncbi:hypothetical protein LBMAG56_03580 [Verrucomicrobiota bacterium]|nr:hypothetical protein LBMAG56_03580 [Verrucomicrobiota bacterium]
MSVMYLLIPLSIMIAAGFLYAFFWAVRSGQFEDTTTPSLRPLLDDTPAPRRPAPASVPAASVHSAATTRSTSSPPSAIP